MTLNSDNSESLLAKELEYTRKFREKQEEIATDARTAAGGFNEQMAGLVQLQQAEILRLQRVLRDNSTVPERHAVKMTVSSATDKDGRVKHVLLAVANDGSTWLMENYSPAGRPDMFRWGRVPLLPQAAAEADAGR
jgi:hypothetical protein